MKKIIVISFAVMIGMPALAKDACLPPLPRPRPPEAPSAAIEPLKDRLDYAFEALAAQQSKQQSFPSQPKPLTRWERLQKKWNRLWGGN